MDPIVSKLVKTFTHEELNRLYDERVLSPTLETAIRLRAEEEDALRRAERKALAYSRWETYRQQRRKEHAEVERTAFADAVSEELKRLNQKVHEMNPGTLGQLVSLDYESQVRAQEKARKTVEEWERHNPARVVSDFLDP